MGPLPLPMQLMWRGPVVTGLSIGTANGLANYHGGYVSSRRAFQRPDLPGNLTISKALGLNAITSQPARCRRG